MKKIRNFIAILLTICILSGCAYTDVEKQIKSTSFKTSEVQKEEDLLIAQGEVKVYDSYGVLLSVEVSEDISGTFNIIYTKDNNELKIFQDYREIMSLDKAAVDYAKSGNIDVDLEKGINNFIISGEDCMCEYKVTFSVSDESKVQSFDGGFLMPHE